MITARAWAGKRYGVLGLARSGAATVRALLASGASVVAWDADEGRRAQFLPGTGRGTGEAAGGGAAPGALLAESPLHHPAAPDGPPPLAGEELTIADLAGVDLSTLDALVVSPGVPLNTHPLAARARAAGVPIIGDIELFAQARSELPPHKVVGITGTNGKSTTTALIHHILQTAGVPSLMGGNIGLPILGQEPLPAGGVYVLELSSYQIDLTQSLDCDVAVLTNITPDHLDRYDGFEAYAASKVRLFGMQSAVATAVVDYINWIDFDIVTATDESVSTAFTDDFLSIATGDWPALRGPHNAQNAACALATCHVLGLTHDVIAAALRTFPGLPHRMQRVGEHRGVAYVNDSKATNPESAAPALAAFPRVHWIVGGRAKGEGLEACRPGFSHVVRAYTIGEAGPRFAEWLRPHLSVAECGTLEVAVNAASSAALPGDTVLLSPAAASFDQFRDFEARGDAFRSYVEALA